MLAILYDIKNYTLYWLFILCQPQGPTQASIFTDLKPWLFTHFDATMGKAGDPTPFPIGLVEESCGINCEHFNIWKKSVLGIFFICDIYGLHPHFPHAFQWGKWLKWFLYHGIERPVTPHFLAGYQDPTPSSTLSETFKKFCPVVVISIEWP